MKNPKGREAKKVLEIMMPHIRVSGAAVPFGPVQRNLSLHRLRAATAHYGLPSIFVTVSPSDIDAPLLFTFVDPTSGHPLARIVVPILKEMRARAEKVASNPAAAAEVFYRQVRAMLTQLCGQSVSDGRKKSQDGPLRKRSKGIFGTPLAHYAIFEMQGRGSLHTHMAL